VAFFLFIMYVTKNMQNVVDADDDDDDDRRRVSGRPVGRRGASNTIHHLLRLVIIYLKAPLAVCNRHRYHYT
jgi:hypothetical protein